MSWIFLNPTMRLIYGAASALLLFALRSPALADLGAEESQAHYNNAANYAEAGELPAAIIELKNALKEDPGNLAARLLLGNVYLLLGDGASAEAQLEMSQRNGMDLDRIVVPLARARLLQGDFGEILSDFDPEKFEPGIALELRLLRADAQAGLGQFAEARAAYEAAKVGNANDARIPLGLARIDLAEGKLDSVQAHAAAALALSPDLPEALLLRAEALRELGQRQSAMPAYRRVLENKSAPFLIKVRAHLGLAAVLIATDHDAEAQVQIAAVQAMAPNSLRAAYLAAVIKMRAGDLVAARNMLERSPEVLQDFAPAQFLFGIICYGADDLETARSWLNHYLESRPNNLAARKLLGATLLRLNAVGDAMAVLEPGLEQAPDDPQVLFLLGTAKLRSHRPVEAAELLQRAADIVPQNPSVLGQLATSQVATGEHEEALATLKGTLNLSADAGALGYALAFSHLQRGEYEAALKMAQDLRQSSPDSAMMTNLVGAAYAGLKRPDDARKAFEAALEMDPNFLQAHANLAALKAQAGDLNGAEADYLQILDQEKTNVLALMGLAGIEQRRGNASASREWLEKAVAANPQVLQAALALAQNHVARGELTAALDLLASLARQHPADPRVLLTLGRVQEQAARSTDAVETYKRLVDLTGGAVDARTLLARSYQSAGNMASARQILEASLENYPEHWPTAQALVDLVRETEGPDASLAYAERLQKQFPGAHWSDQLVGDVYWRAGNFEAALAAYEKGWAKAPSATLAIALARARVQHDKSRKDATAPLLRWLEFHPADPTVRLSLGNTQLALGDVAAARETFETLKAIEAENPVVWNNLALIYQRAGDPRAAEYGERALELAPHRPEIVDTLAWILLEGGQLERATTLLQQAHQAAPDNPDIAFHYAVALHRSGDDTSAKILLQSLVNSSEAFPAKADAETLLSTLTP